MCVWGGLWGIPTDLAHLAFASRYDSPTEITMFVSVFELWGGGITVMPALGSAAQWLLFSCTFMSSQPLGPRAPICFIVGNVLSAGEGPPWPAALPRTLNKAGLSFLCLAGFSCSEA